MTTEQRKAFRALTSRARRMHNAAEQSRAEASRRMDFLQRMVDEMQKLITDLEAVTDEVHAAARKVYVVTPEKAQHVRNMAQNELSDKYIADKVGLPASVVRQIIHKMEAP